MGTAAASKTDITRWRALNPALAARPCSVGSRKYLHKPDFCLGHTLP